MFWVKWIVYINGPYEQKCINIYCKFSEAWNEIVAVWMDLIRPAASDKASL